MILHIIRSWTRPHWQWTTAPTPHIDWGFRLGVRAESCFSLIGKFVCSYLMCITDILCLVFYFIGAYMCPIPAGREIAEV